MTGRRRLSLHLPSAKSREHALQRLFQVIWSAAWTTHRASPLVFTFSATLNLDLKGLNGRGRHLRESPQAFSVLHGYFNSHQIYITSQNRMAPTEHTILTNYLLLPAQLPSIISLQEFIALFPRQLQSSPQIRTLYRDLQSQRNAIVDAVAEQIEEEAKHGKAMRRAVIRSKREAEMQEQDDEVEIERMVSLCHSQSCDAEREAGVCND